jgi:hypothetical protein
MIAPFDLPEPEHQEVLGKRARLRTSIPRLN